MAVVCCDGKKGRNLSDSRERCLQLKSSVILFPKSQIALRYPAREVVRSRFEAGSNLSATGQDSEMQPRSEKVVYMLYRKKKWTYLTRLFLNCVAYQIVKLCSATYFDATQNGTF